MALLQIPHRCPHCSELADFLLHQMSELLAIDGSNRKPPMWDWSAGVNAKQVPASRLSEAVALSRCPRCRNPVMFVILSTHAQMLASLAQLRDEQRVFFCYDVVQTFPQARRYDAHDAWPEKIRKPFVDAQMMLDEGKSPALVLSACRSVLDVATKEAGGDPRKTIYKRIEELADKGLLLGALRDWSHRVRDLGNDGAHDLDDRTPEECREIVAFIRLFLHVTFELPHAIKGAQKLTADAAPAPAV